MTLGLGGEPEPSQLARSSTRMRCGASMTPDSSEMCLTLRVTLLRSYSKSLSDQPTGSSSMALGPHSSSARSSVIETIASVRPTEPIHIGPEMRLSERSTG